LKALNNEFVKIAPLLDDFKNMMTKFSQSGEESDPQGKK
jgi:hypothetical protein